MPDSGNDDEVNLQKEIIAKLSSELHAYHQSVGLLMPDRTQPEVDMSPIFTDHDARLEECGRLMEQQGKHLDELTERSQQLLTENERLRQTISQGLERTVNQKKREEKEKESGEFASSDSDRSKRLEAENELLSQQSEMLSKEIESSNEAIRVRNKSLASLGQQLSQHESKIGQLSSEKRVGEERLLQKVEEVNDCKERIEKLNLDIQKGNLLRSDLTARVDELNVERMDIENEAESLSEKGKLLSSRVQGLQAKLSSKTCEADSMSEQCRKAERELVVTKKDAQNMAKIISGLEGKLDETTKKESKATREAEEYRAKLDDVSLARDKFEASCNTLQTKIDNLVEQRAEDAKKTAKEQGDLLDSLRLRQTSEISLKETTIHDLRLCNAKLKSASERTSREKSAIEDKYATVTISLKDERASVKASCESLARRIAESESQGIAQTKVVHSLETKVDELQDLLQAADESLAEVRSDSTRERERLERELNESDRASRSLEAEAKKRKRETSRLEKSLEEDSLQLREVLKMKDAEIGQLCSQLKETLTKYDQLMRDRNALYQVQEEKLSEEREVCHRLMARNKDLNRHINMIDAEKLELNNIANENEGKVEQLNIALNDAESKIVDIGKELARSLQEHQDRITREQKIRSELREAQMQLDYLRRQD